MPNYKNLTVADLIMAREWLYLQTNSTLIGAGFARGAQQTISEVDKELWSRLISDETPWGSCEKMEKMEKWEDADFEATLNQLRTTKPETDKKVE
jgi:hypothetical protein